jgi:hypothetical protein
MRIKVKFVRNCNLCSKKKLDDNAALNDVEGSLKININTPHLDSNLLSKKAQSNCCKTILTEHNVHEQVEFKSGLVPAPWTTAFIFLATPLAIIRKSLFKPTCLAYFCT